MQIGLQDLIEGQKVNISCFLDESRILDVTWEVVYCSKRYLLYTLSTIEMKTVMVSMELT